jgi:U4/U6 small nuclear ribonucleoprotein PRP3
MVEKRPYPEGQGPNGDAKRVKGDAALSTARAKAAEIMARIAAKKAEGSTNGASPVATPPPAAAAPNDTAARLAAMKARLEAMKGKQNLEVKPAAPDSTTPKFPTTKGNRISETPKPEAKPKPAAGKQKQPEEEEELENPYFDPKSAGQVRGRVPRAIVFNEHGKYLDQASKLRAQSRLEQIKKMLALQARRWMRTASAASSCRRLLT